MKKRQKRLSALLLAGMMLCLPVSEAYASVAHNAAEGVDGTLLFPGDSMTGITTALTVDGEAAAADESGTWTNEKKKIVYRASTMEDGSVAMTSEGYMLEIVDGVSSKADPEAPADNHYEFPEEEKPEEGKLQDIACYAEGETVKITAADPEEGMQFAGWTTDAEEFELPDALSAETTFVMPGDSFTITANYVEAAPTVYNATVNYGSGAGTYEAGTVVSVSADDRSSEGLMFAGWYVETQNTSVNDTMAAATEFVMPEGEVIITATYEEIPPVTEAPAEETQAPTEETQAPAEETQAPTEETQAPAEETQAPAEETVIDIEVQDETMDNLSAAQSETVQSETVQSETVQSETVQSETTQSETAQSETIQIENQSETVQSVNTQSEAAVTYSVIVENGAGGGEYAAGSAVTIEAQIPAGMAFYQWTVTGGTAVIDNPAQPIASFVMPAEAVSVKAEYTVATHKVTLENATDGNGAAEGTYAENATVTVTAAEAPLGMAFSRFEGTVTVNGTTTALTFADASASQTTFVMPQGDVQVKAVYAELPKTCLVKVSNGLINGSSTQMAVEEGAQITVTANPSPYGQQFSKWTVNDGAYDLGDAAFNSSITVTVTENMNFLAVYEGIQYKVTVEDGYSDYEECVVGTVVTIEADEAPKGMAFDYWYVDTQNVALSDAYSEETTFTMPDGDVSVTAMYKKVKYQVSVQNGTADQEYYYAGDTVTISSKYPASGRVFDTWSAVSGKVSFADASRWKTTFEMPAGDVIVAANYTDGPSSNDNQILDIVAGGEYYTGDTIKFTASGAGMSNTNPNPGDYRYRPSGYQIGNVTGTWKAAPYTTSMAINATGEYTLKVIFNKDVYDGSSWISEGTSDAKTITFRVVTKAAGVATGDETPITLVIAVAAVSCILFVVLLAVFVLRRRKR